MGKTGGNHLGKGEVDELKLKSSSGVPEAQLTALFRGVRSSRRAGLSPEQGTERHRGAGLAALVCPSVGRTAGMF